MWINYTDSEVNVFHPICEKALNAALDSMKLKNIYEVKHHQMVGPLEMDFVIKNKRTGKYLCIIEVKRTPSDVQSARYQYQAMSYVQMGAPILEKPFFILTNLEYSYSFRYDSKKPRVFQQILAPGLQHIGNFKDNDETSFLDILTIFFKCQIERFINDNYSYMFTLDHFADYMSKIKMDRKAWKSSLVCLLYEYIRGSFSAIGRNSYKDVRTYHNDIKSICDAAAKVNFKGIFEYNASALLPSISVDSTLLTNMFHLGRQNVSADLICDVIHSIACEGEEHDGKVSTDAELARLVAILAKSVYNNPEFEGKVCDPAAGSGSLISSSIDILNLRPNQIFANDIDGYLLELLSLRLGLRFPGIVECTNSPTVLNNDIIKLEKSDFNDVGIVVLNPPYIAGINCVTKKKKLSARIKELNGVESITNCGQIGYEALFIELINSLIAEGTVISCIIPKQYLMARGIEAINFRRFLINNFGLQIIFNYPGIDIFNSVLKDTCVIVGRKGCKNETIKVFSSLESVQNIDLVQFGQALSRSDLKENKFCSITPGLEAMKIDKIELNKSSDDGWRLLNSELCEAIEFVNKNFKATTNLRTIEDLGIKLVRGQVGNNGASDLLYIDSNTKLWNDYKDILDENHPGMRNAVILDFLIENGDSSFLNCEDYDELLLEDLINDYLDLDRVQGKQLKKEKDETELYDLLVKEARHITPKYSVLIPRNLRSMGKAYILTKDTYVSTNFVILKAKNKKESEIIGSWMSTIFYQLICEISAKDQEGTRKMEMKDIYKTLIPKIGLITDDQYAELSAIISGIEFIDLQKPKQRLVDIFWSKVLFGDDAQNILNEAEGLLKFAAKRRNVVL